MRVLIFQSLECGPGDPAPGMHVRESRQLRRLALGALHALVFVTIGVALGSCSSAPYRYETPDQIDFKSRAETSSAGSLTVRTAVLTAAEGQALFGVDLQDRQIQPVWIEVSNQNESRARIAISSIDPKYFPPSEVAFFYRKKFSKQGWKDMEKRLIEMALPRFVQPGETISGFVFTNEAPGTKAFNVDIYQASIPPSFDQFTFFVAQPGFEPDTVTRRLEKLYSGDEIVHVNEQQLRGELEKLDCCTSNQDGTALGRPVNIFMVADTFDLIRALLSSGWVETPRMSSESGPESAYHLFGRPADGMFRKLRDEGSDRTELQLWLTPVRVDGLPMFAGQLRQSIGRRFQLGDRLFGVHVDPDTVEGRNYALQTFWYGQTLEQWAYSDSGRVVPESEPETDFLGHPWFSIDDLRLVIWISEKPIALPEARILRWLDHAAGGEKNW